MKRIAWSFGLLAFLACVVACGGGKPNAPAVDKDQPNPAPDGPTDGKESKSKPDPIRNDGTDYAAWVRRTEQQIQKETNGRVAEYENAVKQRQDALEMAKGAYEEALKGEKFSRKKEARANYLNAASALNNTILAKPSAATAPGIPSLEFDRAREGDFGRVNTALVAFQVLDSGKALMKFGDDIYFVDTGTRGMVDGKTYEIKGFYECTGTQQYTTPIGTTKTVMRFRQRSEISIRPPTISVPKFELTTVAAANVPEPARPPLPTPNDAWSTDWKTAGDVQVRLAAVVFGPATLLDKKEDREPSAKPCLMLWIEVKNMGKAKRVYKRFNPALSGECTVKEDDSFVFLTTPKWQNGLKFEFNHEYEVALEPGQTIVERVAVEPPSSGTPGVTLKVDAARVGERGILAFSIPASVWKKK